MVYTGLRVDSSVANGKTLQGPYRYYATQSLENQDIGGIMGAPGRATYTVEETAKILGVGRAAVYAALRKGIVPSYRCGKRFIIPKTAVQVWLRNAPARAADLSGPSK